MKEENKISFLEGLSFVEWILIKNSVDYAFSLKRKEQEKNLKLSSDEMEKAMRSQFG